MKPVFSVNPVAMLRAQRDYVHSTDLYSGLVDALVSRGIQPKGFDLKIKGRIVSQPRLDFFREDPPAPTERPSAAAKFDTTDGIWIVRVYAGNQPLVERRAYDESALWASVTHVDNSFEVRACVGYTPIEIVTAVGVLAHKTLFPPAPGTRWLLGQISAKRMLGEAELQHFRLDVAKTLGPKMTQSNMIDANGVFGKMLFILK